MPLERKAEASAKYKATVAGRTPEEWAVVNAKISAALLARNARLRAGAALDTPMPPTQPTTVPDAPPMAASGAPDEEIA